MQDFLTNEALIERFNHIMEWVNKLTGVRINTGAKLEEPYSIQNDCLRLLGDIKDNELTSFMVAPILEHYLTLLRPAIVIPVDDLLAGKRDKWDEVSELIADLAEHPVRNQWAAKAETFRQIAESAGYTFERSDYQDLAVIAPIVANALTTFDTTHYIRTIYKVREGDFSMKSPILLDEIHIFHDIADAVQVYERIPVPAFIGFFGIEQTYGENNNVFEDWRYGRNARKNNVMKNGLTEDDYNATVDEHSRKVYCIVRDGGSMWVFQPPINTSHNECTRSDGSFTNFYGHRSTYAPIQIFWDAFAGSAETTALVPYKPRKWSLKDIMDEDQKVWLPIFFNTVKHKFFGDVEPKSEPAWLIKETQVTLQLTGSEQNTNLPAVVHTQVTLPDIDNLFGRDKIVDENGRTESFIGDRERTCYRGATDMLAWLGITAEDIADAPIGFFGMKSTKDAMQEMEEQTVAAYYKVLRERLPILWKSEAPKAYRWLHDKIDAMHEQIVTDINDGRTKVEWHVHKKPVLDENGDPIFRKKYSWREETVQLTDETDIELGKVYNSTSPYLHPYQWFSSASLMDKRPPATISIYCKTPEDIAHLLHCEVKDLPLPLQYMQYAEAFCDRHARICADVHFIYNKSDFKKTFPNFT